MTNQKMRVNRILDTDVRILNHDPYHHILCDIFIIAILASICGKDSWESIAAFARDKQDWLSTFLALPNGIPHEKTFHKVFSLFDPNQFDTWFQAWVDSLIVNVRRQKITLDKALQSIEIWHKTDLPVFGQMITLQDHSYEPVVIPTLLERMQIQGQIITVDAIDPDQLIAKQIIDAQADYVQALNDPHHPMLENVKKVFEKAEQNHDKRYKNVLHLRRVQKFKEGPVHYAFSYTLASEKKANEFGFEWPGFKGIAKVHLKRAIYHKVQYITRYYLTSLYYDKIEQFIEAVKSHWQTQTPLHWSFGPKVNADHGQQNLSLLADITGLLLKQEKSQQLSTTEKQALASVNTRYLLKILKADPELVMI